MKRPLNVLHCHNVRHTALCFKRHSCGILGKKKNKSTLQKKVYEAPCSCRCIEKAVCVKKSMFLLV